MRDVATWEPHEALDTLQQAVIRFVDVWVSHHGLSSKQRAALLPVNARTYNRLRAGDRDMRTKQMVEIAAALNVPPYYLTLPGSLTLTDHQIKVAIEEAAKFERAIYTIMTLPARERSILFSHIDSFAVAANWKQRETTDRGVY